MRLVHINVMSVAVLRRQFVCFGRWPTRVSVRFDFKSIRVRVPSMSCLEYCLTGIWSFFFSHQADGAAMGALFSRIGYNV
jgi:hypothetical protein